MGDCTKVVGRGILRGTCALFNFFFFFFFFFFLYMPSAKGLQHTDIITEKCCSYVFLCFGGTLCECTKVSGRDVLKP